MDALKPAETRTGEARDQAGMAVDSRPSPDAWSRQGAGSDNAHQGDTLP
jgi:hypothetical protein